jgi:peptide chain release factor 3
MLVDAAKGLETQTRKLFEVCRMRDIPIFTFINKLDRPARDSLELIDEIEKELGLSGLRRHLGNRRRRTFQGIYNRLTGNVHLYETKSARQETSRRTNNSLQDSKIESLSAKKPCVN